MRKIFGRRRPETALSEADVDVASADIVDDADVDPARTRLRVAVVDDDDDVRELLQLGLNTQDYEVVGTAADAGLAIDMVSSAQPDIILLDLHMPDMGGLEVLPRLRELCPNAKIVAFSAIGATHMVENAIEASVFGFIEKGVTIDSILKHLDRVRDAGRVKFVRPFPLNRDYS